MRYKLIIKGDKKVAYQELNHRNITVFAADQDFFQWPINESETGVEFTSNASFEITSIILNKWFTESTTAPFPVGSLLWWGLA